MPLITCEMRWVLEGPLPDEIERWFQSGPRPAPVAWRDDRYLILPGIADMGIKRREGRLEIKGRTAQLGSHPITPAIEGAVERWCKWTYGAAVKDRLRPSFQRRGAIIVGKGRMQRHFLLAPAGAPAPGDLAQETAQRDLGRRGFSLELTRIRLPPGAVHWSLGVEAAPDDPILPADLLRALSDLLQGFPIALPGSRSMSYPQWLLEVGGAARRPDR
jgi:hypothetical protein